MHAKTARWASPDAVTLVGAPLAVGQPLAGVDLGPKALRNAGIESRIRELGYKVSDVGDVATPQLASDEPARGCKHPRTIGGACEALRNAVRDAVAGGSIAITMGGDHSVAAGTVAGSLAARPDTAVVWVDAHADINTPASSPSGNMHGMPVALLLGMAGDLPGFEWLHGALAANRIAYIGLRDLDPGEKETIRALGIKAFTMQDVDRMGIAQVSQQALDHVNPYGRLPTHLSLDIDSIDPAFACSTGTTVPGGLTFREAHFVCEEVARSGTLSAMDIVEVNPLINPGPNNFGADSTVNLGLHLVLSSLGKNIL